MMASPYPWVTNGVRIVRLRIPQGILVAVLVAGGCEPTKVGGPLFHRRLVLRFMHELMRLPSKGQPHRLWVSCPL